MWGVKPTSTISSYSKIGLYFLGIWPGARYRAAFRMFWATAVIMTQTFHCQYIIAYFKYDSLSHLMDVMSIMLVYNVLSMKIIVFWINDRVFQDLLAVMSDESETYGADDSNNLMTRTANFSHYVTNTIIATYPLCIIFYALGVFAYRDPPEEESFLPRKLIMMMKLPFKYDTWPLYEITIAVQFVFQIISAISYGILSAILLTVILHVGCQIDILCREITEISFKKGERFGRLIEKHQAIIIFIRKIEELFTYIALVQFVSNTLNICSVGYLIVISIGTENASAMFMKCGLFYFVIAMDAFVSCFAGEYLSIKTRMIGDAAYESLWYDLRPDECHMLLLMILRSQKELTISIGKISNLSLNSFATILKASMSYMSVLLAMS